MSDHRTIYLAPPCCYSEGEGRQWCQDNVWPCSDCPEPGKAMVSKYVLAEQFRPASDDPEERDE